MKNEIRVGNYITDEWASNSAYFEVLSIGVETVKYGANFKARYNNVRRIVLDDEWLKRFGFYQLPHFTVGNSWLFDFGLSQQISISFLGTPNLCVWLSCIDDKKRPTDLVCVWNWDLRGDIHVHDLQNLFYSLTGTELTINK